MESKGAEREVGARACKGHGRRRGACRACGITVRRSQATQVFWEKIKEKGILVISCVYLLKSNIITSLVSCSILVHSLDVFWQRQTFLVVCSKSHILIVFCGKFCLIS